MIKKIKIKGQEINYILKKRRGNKRMRLAIYSDGTFMVSAPKWYPLYIINRFILGKAEWILEKLGNRISSNPHAERKKDYKNKKLSAEKKIKEQVEFFNKNYNFFYNRISIRNQRTCWGSCSRKKNLNFNYRVTELSEELMNYVIVHELCHLEELNHGKRFWFLVAKTFPQYKKIKKQLKKI